MNDYDMTEDPSWYRMSATILYVGGIAKVFSAIYLQLADTGLNVFLLKPGVLIAIGIYEFLLARLLLRVRSFSITKLILTFWTGTAFLATHMFLYSLKIGGCPCLGIFGGTGGVLTGLLNGVVVCAAVYIFAGSFYYFRKEIQA